MPTTIYPKGNPPKKLALLCEDDWNLPQQIYSLEIWLRKNKTKVKKGKFIADVGFKIRKDASGGGTSLSSKMMRTMSDLGISLYLSEYL